MRRLVCTKNVAKLSLGQYKEWMNGIDIDYDGDPRGFVIIKHKDDYLG